MSLFLPWGELHKLMSNPEDLYFELKNVGLRGVERFFGHEGGVAQLRSELSEVRYE